MARLHSPEGGLGPPPGPSGQGEAPGGSGAGGVGEPRLGPPLRAVLHCPRCGARHVDRGEWAHRLHRTHLCDGCGQEFVVEPECAGVGDEPLPRDRDSRTTHFSIWTPAGEVDGYVTVGFMPDGASVREFFVKLGKIPGRSEEYDALSAMLDATAMCASKALAAGVPLAWFVRMFRYVKFEPRGRTNLFVREGVPFICSSSLDLLGFILGRYLPAEGEG